MAKEREKRQRRRGKNLRGVDEVDGAAVLVRASIKLIHHQSDCVVNSTRLDATRRDAVKFVAGEPGHRRCRIAEAREPVEETRTVEEGAGAR